MESDAQRNTYGRFTMQMSRPSLSQLLRAGEVVYAIVALFALTQGPVYRLWSESGMYQQFIPLPTVGHAHFATFCVIQLPALIAVSRRLNTALLRDPRGQALLALMLWLGFSVMWSTFARQSLPEFVSLFFTTSFGIFLASNFSLRAFWRIIVTAMSSGLALSLFAIQRGWGGAVNAEQNYWIGIYFNRNSLAPVAAVAVISVAGIICTRQRNRGLRRSLQMVSYVVVMAIAVLTLWQAKSQTSPFAILVACLALLSWLGIRFGTKNRWTKISENSAGIAAALVAIVVLLSLRVVGGISVLGGETATFNSRESLWNLSWSGFLVKPLHGWGWLAAWRTISFFQQGEWWAVWDTEWSHSGYHDLLLGGGVVAAALFAAVVWFGMRAINCHVSLREAIPSFLIVAFVLAAATQESFFIGTHFLWALLIAGLFTFGHLESDADTASVEKQDSGNIAPRPSECRTHLN